MDPTSLARFIRPSVKYVDEMTIKKIFWICAWKPMQCKYNMSCACDFQQCGILTSVDSDEPVQPPFKLRKLQTMFSQ